MNELVRYRIKKYLREKIQSIRTPDTMFVLCLITLIFVFIKHLK